MNQKTISTEKTLSVQAIENQLAPYSENAFAQFFQKIWRWWLGVWSTFSENKPKFSKFVYTFALFYLISNIVTILQGVLLNIIPNWFGIELAAQAFAWPGIPYHVFGEDLQFIIFGYGVETNAVGDAVIGGGLGYFYSFMIATFIAQLINFPLQRNFTYRSKGNPWYQALWYLIGWLGINVVIWIIIGNLAEWNRAFIGIAPAVLSWINVVIQGGVAMVIFYFIFLVIFPDVHKLADQKEEQVKAKVALLEEAKKSGDATKVASLETEVNKLSKDAAEMRKLSNIKNAEKNILTVKSTTETKIIKVISLQKLLDKKIASDANDEEINKIKEHLEKAIEVASKAIQQRDHVIKENELVIAENA